MWCDNTGKGTKNWMMLWFFSYLCTSAHGHEKYFESADLCFFFKGHTFMTGTGPDACHNMFKMAKKQTKKNKDMITVEDWLAVARVANSGSFEVVHLKTGLHFDWEKFLSLAYKEPKKPRNYILREFHWFHFENPGEVIARHRHSPERRFTRMEIAKSKWGKYDPTTFTWPAIQDFVLDAPLLSMTTCVGIIKSMVMMDLDAIETWKTILVDQIGQEEYDRQSAAMELDEQDSDCSTDSADDSDERVRKRSIKMADAAALKKKRGIRPRGYREDYAGDKDIAPVDKVSKARRRRQQSKQKEKQQAKRERDARNQNADQN